MIVQISKNARRDQVDHLVKWLEGFNLQVHSTVGVMQTILGLVGDTSRVDIDLIRSMEIVEDVKRIQEPYKNANRKFHPDDTVVKVGNTCIGDGRLSLIAGPCSVESEEQVCMIAREVKKSGATMLRGGAFKPRSSPSLSRDLVPRVCACCCLPSKTLGFP